MGCGVNWCRGCNGHGSTGWLWWRKVCPVCKADDRNAVYSRSGRVEGYTQPPPGHRTEPTPPAQVRCIFCKSGVLEDVTGFGDTHYLRDGTRTFRCRPCGEFYHKPHALNQYQHVLSTALPTPSTRTPSTLPPETP